VINRFQLIIVVFFGHDLAADQAAAMRCVARLVTDQQQPASLTACLTRLQDIGSTLRDRISRDTWRVLRQLRETLEPPRFNPLDPTDVLTRLEELSVPFAAWSGLTHEGMTHGYGWRFLDLGRRLERALHTTTLVRCLLVERDRHESLVLTALLASVSSEMTYRARYRLRTRPLPTLDLVLRDERNPRSLRYQVDRIREHLDALPGRPSASLFAEADPDPISRLMLILETDPALLAEYNPNGRREALRRVTEQLDTQLPQLAAQIAAAYLVHADAQPASWAGLPADAIMQEETI
jgi:uncharacterized alpha-E superfamily protein